MRTSRLVLLIGINFRMGQQQGDNLGMVLDTSPNECSAVIVRETGISPVDHEIGVLLQHLPHFFLFSFLSCIIQFPLHYSLVAEKETSNE